MNQPVSKEAIRPREIFILLRALGRLDARPGHAQGPLDPARARERDLLRERLPTELARLYDRLFDSGRRPTVVETVREHCAGCHVRVPPQIMVLLTRAELICRCPNCHRFLSPSRLDLDSPNA